MLSWKYTTQLKISTTQIFVDTRPTIAYGTRSPGFAPISVQATATHFECNTTQWLASRLLLLRPFHQHRSDPTRPDDSLSAFAFWGLISNETIRGMWGDGGLCKGYSEQGVGFVRSPNAWSVRTVVLGRSTNNGMYHYICTAYNNVSREPSPHGASCALASEIWVPIRFSNLSMLAYGHNTGVRVWHPLRLRMYFVSGRVHVHWCTIMMTMRAWHECVRSLSLCWYILCGYCVHDQWILYMRIHAVLCGQDSVVLFDGRTLCSGYNTSCLVYTCTYTWTGLLICPFERIVRNGGIVYYVVRHVYVRECNYVACLIM